MCLSSSDREYEQGSGIGMFVLHRASLMKQRLFCGTSGNQCLPSPGEHTTHTSEKVHSLRVLDPARTGILFRVSHGVHKVFWRTYNCQSMEVDAFVKAAGPKRRPTISCTFVHRCAVRHRSYTVRARCSRSAQRQRPLSLKKTCQLS